MMSSNNKGNKTTSLWWMLSMELTMHNNHVSTANFLAYLPKQRSSLFSTKKSREKGATEFIGLHGDSTTHEDLGGGTRGPGPARVGLLGCQCSARALFRTASFKIK
jgi:hypothetical protein